MPDGIRNLVVFQERRKRRRTKPPCSHPLTAVQLFYINGIRITDSNNACLKIFQQTQHRINQKRKGKIRRNIGTRELLMTECEMGGARNRTLVIICIGGMCTMPLAGSIGRTGTPIRLQTQTFRMMVMGKNRYGQHQDAGYQQAVCLKDTSQFRFVLISAKIGHIGQTDKRIGKNRHKKNSGTGGNSLM